MGGMDMHVHQPGNQELPGAIDPAGRAKTTRVSGVVYGRYTAAVDIHRTPRQNSFLGGIDDGDFGDYQIHAPGFRNDPAGDQAKHRDYRRGEMKRSIHDVLPCKIFVVVASTNGTNHAK